MIKNKFRTCLVCIIVCLSTFVFSQTTAPSQAAHWIQTAKSNNPDFEASTVRGKAFYSQVFTHNKDFPNCAACHTANPAAQGKHAITGKSIAPLAPKVNSERFTDQGKTDKWFKRNCNDVLGRECTSGEKADFIIYLIGAK